MTIKQTLINKIGELETAKTSLLNKAAFLNPNNNTFIYSTLSIQDTDGVGGATPQGLREILSTVVGKINEYTSYLRKMPNRETLAIRNDRGVYKYVVLSSGSKVAPKITWEKISDNVSFSSVQQYLPSSVYHGAATSIKIECFPIMRKGGENGAPVDMNATMLRLNPRKGIQDIYSSGGGGMSVSFDEKHLYGDDVFIIGIKVNQAVIQGAVYYVDLTFSIETEAGNGTVTKDYYTINDIQIGNMVLDVDTSLLGGVLMWSAFVVNDFEVGIRNSSTNKRALIPNGYYGTLDDGDIVTEIIVGSEVSDIGAHRLSYRRRAFKGRILNSDTYSLYDKKENGVARIIVKNIIPIDIVLAEAIDAL